MKPFLLALALIAPTFVLAQDPTAELILEAEGASVGDKIAGTVVLTFAPGLHAYQNPPSIDYLIPVSVAGESLYSVDYPKGTMEMAGGVMAASYSGTVRIPVVFDAAVAAGPLDLKLTIHYQQCDKDACFLPADLIVLASLNVAPRDEPDTAPEDSPSAENRPQQAEPEAEQTFTDPNVPPAVSIEIGNETVPAGSETTVYVLAEFAPGLHAYQNPPTKDYMIPVTVTGAEGTEVLNVEYPTGTVEFVAGEQSAVYMGSVRIPVTVRAASETGPQSITLELNYQQCTEQACFAPDTVQATVELQVSEALPESADGSEGDGLVAGLLSSDGMLAVVLGSILLGLALTLTPCVYPMIPITVTFFSNQTASGSAGRLGLGAMFTAGLALTYGVFGGIVAALGGAIGGVFRSPIFLLALAAILIGLALSMYDLYEIRLPGFIQRNLKSRSGPVGALVMGMLMGFAAAPCAGALLSAVAFDVASIGSIPLGLARFTAIGFGLGLPFMVVAASATGLKALPKSGGWLKTVKAVLGFVVLGFGFNYVLQAAGFISEELRTQVAWIVIYAGFAVFLVFFDVTVVEIHKQRCCVRPRVEARLILYVFVTTQCQRLPIRILKEQPIEHLARVQIIGRCK
ncbi:MAG: hypothetical protein IH945_03375 [Armatimonadetes bacterium]|nr:hypothetical protein [Armatimonadota bacterium]